MIGRYLRAILRKGWWWAERVVTLARPGRLRFTDASATLAFEDATDAVRFADASALLAFEDATDALRFTDASEALTFEQV